MAICIDDRCRTRDPLEAKPLVIPGEEECLAIISTRSLNFGPFNPRKWCSDSVKRSERVVSKMHLRFSSRAASRAMIDSLCTHATRDLPVNSSYHGHGDGQVLPVEKTASDEKTSGGF